MNQHWDVDDIIQHFTLLPEEVSFIGINAPHNQLGKALLFKFFQHESRFPENTAEISPEIIEYWGFCISPRKGIWPLFNKRATRRNMLTKA